MIIIRTPESQKVVKARFWSYCKLQLLSLLRNAKSIRWKQIIIFKFVHIPAEWHKYKTYLDERESGYRKLF